MCEEDNMLAEIPLEGYFTNRITSEQEYTVNNKLFLTAQAYYENPRIFGVTYGVIYEGLQHELSKHTTVFDHLFNFAESSLTVKNAPFRLLHSLEDIQHAVRANNPDIDEFSYYTCMYFIMTFIAAKNRVQLKSIDKVTSFDIDMKHCKCRKYFDILLLLMPQLHRKSSFFKTYASDIYSALHYYCSVTLTKYQNN